MDIGHSLNPDKSPKQLTRNNDHEKGTEEMEQEEPRTAPLLMYQYLQKLGEKQKQIIENFYQSAVDGSCQNVTCDGSTAEGFICNFLSTTQEDEGDFSGDILHQHIVGPVACEYCKSSDTSKCDESCERPKLFFLKRRPPFENSKEGYSKSGEYLEDLSNHLKLLSQAREQSENGGKRKDSILYQFTF